MSGCIIYVAFIIIICIQIFPKSFPVTICSGFVPSQRDCFISSYCRVSVWVGCLGPLIASFPICSPRQLWIAKFELKLAPVLPEVLQFVQDGVQLAVGVMDVLAP